jgi:hypothetical protein
MEKSRTQHDQTGNVAVTVDSGWMNDVATSMSQRVVRPMTRLEAVSAGDVTREALHLALSALHIDIAWHAGVVSADAAMEDLHREIAKTINRCNESTRTGSLDQADHPQLRGTPIGQRNRAAKGMNDGSMSHSLLDGDVN